MRPLKYEHYERRMEIYRRVAPVFRQHGYRGATLKQLAHAAGLSIPALYRYFPSKRSLAFFPLVAAEPELHPVAPDASKPLLVLSGFVRSAVEQLPYYSLAMQLSIELGVEHRADRRTREQLDATGEVLARCARCVAPRLGAEDARDLASTMLTLAIGSTWTGPRSGARLRRLLQAALRTYLVPAGLSADRLDAALRA